MKFVAYVLVAIPSLMAMGVARLIGCSRWYEYLFASLIGGVGSGVFFATVATAMATAYQPSQARWKGAIIGAVIGVVTWMIVSGIQLLLAKPKM